MIRVTIELVPQGDESRAKTLHTALIANDGSGTRARGNYRFKLSHKGSARPWKEGRISGFPRKRLGAWHLLYRVLKEALDA